jgi:hypothetical protein
MINPQNIRKDKNGTEWVSLAAIWKNPDGTMNLMLNEHIKPGTKLRFLPNRSKQPGSKAPDFFAGAKLSLYDEQEGEVLREDR